MPGPRTAGYGDRAAVGCKGVVWFGSVTHFLRHSTGESLPVQSCLIYHDHFMAENSVAFSIYKLVVDFCHFWLFLFLWPKARTLTAKGAFAFACPQAPAQERHTCSLIPEGSLRHQTFLQWHFFPLLVRKYCIASEMTI